MHRAKSRRRRAIALATSTWFATAALPGSALEVVSTSPDPYMLQVSDSLTQISITFDQVPLTPSADAIRVCGVMSGIHATALTENGATWSLSVSSDWLPGELVNVNLSADIHTASGDSLAGGHYLAFTIESGLAPASWGIRDAYGASDIPYFIFGGDLDNDGTPDIAVPNEGTHDFSVWLNTTGDGIFTNRAEYGVGEVPSSCFGEDFDNDGDIDLATADHRTGTTSVALNNGDGSFAPSTLYPSGSNTRQVHGGDFDGDNDIDICSTSFDTDVVYLFYNAGDGTYDSSVVYADVADGPFAIRTGDFNLDGHLDIGVASRNADSLNVLTNAGDGTFTTTGRFKTGAAPWDLDGNDFDGDGDFDLVTVASDPNRIQVLINDGTGAFPTKKGRATGFFPLGVYAADLDGDGDTDATSSNFGSGTVGVYLNDGTGQLDLAETLVVDISGSYAWAHDLDADGDLDISVVDERADSMYVFFNDGPVDSPIVGERTHGVWITAVPNPALASRGTTMRLGGFSGPVVVEVFTVGGRRVRRLYEGEPSKTQSIFFDGLDQDAQPLPAGAYFVSVRGESHRASAVVRLVR